MEPTTDFRKKYIAIGEARAREDVRKEVLDDLQDVAGSDDVELALQNYISQLSAQIDADRVAARGGGTTDVASMAAQLRSLRAGATGSSDDLTAQVAARMAAARGKAPSGDTRPSTTSTTPEDEAARIMAANRKRVG